jgi:hypothetical protein
LRKSSRPRSFRRCSKKNGEAISQTGDGQVSGHGSRFLHTIRLIGFLYQRILLSLRAQARLWELWSGHLADLIDRQPSKLGLCGLCYLYLHNLKGLKWNHKGVYRIYKELGAESTD